MTLTEQREAARLFFQKWSGKGHEDEDDRSYWIDILLNIFGITDATDHIQFQKKVIVDGNTKKIDVYLPETKVIIEQKSLGKKLDVKMHQSDGDDLTPYEQAKRYNDNLPYEEKARWIITSNFEEIWIYDMNAKVPAPEKLLIKNFQDEYTRLNFLVPDKKVKISQEVQLSIQAGELVGKIYDRFLNQYQEPSAPITQKSLNILCVRLVFCLYAEDAGLFGEKDAFSSYISQYEPKDIRQALINLFQILDTKLDERDPYIDDELAAFPYVNGGLFRDEHIIIPKITQDIKETLLESGNFNWSKISPTIFGAVFESTLNPETRRAGGMHYTSVENIHKVIDPLFLDELSTELDEIAGIATPSQKRKKLDEYQDKLANLSFFDPACGSGNFLTESFLSLRRLENRAIATRVASYRGGLEGQITMGFEDATPIKVNIQQFYGIEINDFAVAVAQTAMWIADAQMFIETQSIVHSKKEFLPLQDFTGIKEENALDVDWNSVVDRNKITYIFGNPPFLGGSTMSAKQKAEATRIFGKIRLANSMDYVCAWYFKAAEFIQGTNIRVAFVSTNSITQGEQVAPLWGTIMPKYGIKIDFAYRTFIWDSEASQKAHVHCVIIGFSRVEVAYHKKIFEDTTVISAKNINPYLIDAPDVIIESFPKPICEVPPCVLGNTAKDNGNLLMDEEEYKAFCVKYPNSQYLLRRYIGGRDFLHNDEKRYCFWLKGVAPNEFSGIPEIKKRLEKVREFRAESTSKDTRIKAETPYLFFRTPHVETDYIIIPRTTSERRRYIPAGFMSKDSIGSDAVMVVYDASLFLFGIIESNVHAAWLRTVGGRLKSDYRYSAVIVYNSFPFPKVNAESRKLIEQTAEGILSARALYPNSSLADLYDPLTMPLELRKAHQKNDIAVMKAYGFDVKNTSESDCVAKLMKMYEKITSEIKK